MKKKIGGFYFVIQFVAGSQKEKSPAREMNPKSGATAPALFWIYGMPIGNVDVTPTKSSLPVTEQGGFLKIYGRNKSGKMVC